MLFVLAFTASSLVELMPSKATRWQRRNRRYLGVSFAVSHFIHLGVILALAALDRELFWKLTNLTTIVLAGTAYLFWCTEPSSVTGDVNVATVASPYQAVSATSTASAKTTSRVNSRCGI